MNGQQRALILPTDRAYLLAVSKNHDLLLPFQELTPSAQRLRHLFDGQAPDSMTTESGFRNAVATRFFTYNSRFLLSGAQKFTERLEDLIEVFSTAEESFFVSAHIYGRYGGGVGRRTANAQVVWESCNFPRHVGRSFMRFWNALHQSGGCKIKWVGHFLALKIAGKEHLLGQ